MLHALKEKAVGSRKKLVEDPLADKDPSDFDYRAQVCWRQCGSALAQDGITADRFTKFGRNAFGGDSLSRYELPLYRRQDEWSGCLIVIFPLLSVHQDRPEWFFRAVWTRESQDFLSHRCVNFL